MTNLYAVQKGMTSLRCENFYSEQGGEIEIPLDPRLTPSQNAQRYYKEYKKADTAEKKLVELIAQGEREQQYIDSVLDSLTRADSEADISQLREELAEQGYIKKRSLKAKTMKSLPPLKFVSDDGYTILVGRHNRQNDRLTLKDSQKSDIWLHTQNITGSHTVICTNGTEPPFFDDRAGGAHSGLPLKGARKLAGAGGLHADKVRQKTCRCKARHGDIHKSENAVRKARRSRGGAAEKVRSVKAYEDTFGRRRARAFKRADGYLKAQ